MRDYLKLFIVAMLIFAGNAQAQSTNPSSPTSVNGTYSGKGPSNETNYYFQFTANPGDITVKLDIKAKDYSTFARIEIGNDPANLIAMANMNASTTTGAATVSKNFKLESKQTVRIKLTLDANLAEYTLSIKGGGPIFSSGGGSSGTTGSKTSDDAGTGKTGSIGKLTTAGGSKLGKVATSGGNKPKTGTQNSDDPGDKGKLSFTCPNEVMYTIVATAGWNPTLHSQKRYLFDSADVDGPRLVCSYKGIGSDDAATLMKEAPAGYSCVVFKGGSKSRDFNCTTGVTAALGRPIEDWQFVLR